MAKNKTLQNAKRSKRDKEHAETVSVAGSVVSTSDSAEANASYGKSTPVVEKVNFFEAAKVVVRLGADGEPCAATRKEEVTFVAYYFVAWRSFDESNHREYAECTFLPGKECKRGNASFMVPVASVYFVHPVMASLAGFDPHPKQDVFFPELITRLLPPLMQPMIKTITYSKPGGRTIVSGSVTRRVTRAQLTSAYVIGCGLELRRSRIPDSGRGVFATQNFLPNELITLYFGHQFGETQRLELQAGSGGSHCKPLQFKHSYLDGVKVGLTGMSCGQLLNQGDKQTVNCDWIVLEYPPAEKALGVRATRFIHPGEELYISYGKKFWDEQSMEPAKVPPVVLPLIPNP